MVQWWLQMSYKLVRLEPNYTYGVHSMIVDTIKRWLQLRIVPVQLIEVSDTLCAHSPASSRRTLVDKRIP